MSGRNDGSGGTNAITIQKLNGTNYLQWRRAISMMLELKGLEAAIELDDVPRRLETNKQPADLLKKPLSSHELSDLISISSLLADIVL